MSRRITIGFDLSAQPRDTAACVLDWTTAPARVVHLECHLADVDVARLVEVHKPDKVAIDAPFGWPRPFVNAVAKHDRLESWSDANFDKLVLRTTDMFVQEQTGKRPLSVSADKIAVTAMRCARILSLLSRGGSVFSRSGSGLVVEAYPGAALVQWGYSPSGYKGSKVECRETRRLLVASVAQAASSWLTLEGSTLELLTLTDHYFDALICAIVARAQSIDGLTIPIPLAAQAEAEVEGWIHLPQRGSLEHVRLFPG